MNFLEALNVVDNNLRDIGINIENNSLKLLLTAGNENTLNPSLVLDAFFAQYEIEPIFYTVKRTMIFNENLEEFE